MKKISIAQPNLAGNESKYVLDCLETTWISSNGKYINSFESEFAMFCGVKHAISTNNGTTALHLALVGLNVNPGDEVIVPTVTYIATANAVRYCGAIPVFVDVCPETLNIDPELVEKKITNKTKGIIAVHLYGNPADMEALTRIAKKHQLWVVEDAAEAHGAEIYSKRVGSMGNCATFSFFGNKIITTGEGGMITTNDDSLAEKFRLYRGQGMDSNRRYWFPVVGYNYRMTNIQAALGLAQLERVELAVAYRDQVAEWYKSALSTLTAKIILPAQPVYARSVCWLYTIFLRNGDNFRRNQLIFELSNMGIETRPVFYPLHMMPPYKESTSYAVADTWALRGLNLPTHELLKKSDISFIADCLSIALKKI